MVAQRFVPTRCVALLEKDSRRGVLERLGARNATLFFAGDSLTANHFSALSFMVKSELGTGSELVVNNSRGLSTSFTWRTAPRVGDAAAVGDVSVGEREGFLTTALAYNAELGGLAGGVFNAPRWDELVSHVFPHTHRGESRRARDFIVFSMGAHLQHSTELFRTALTAWRDHVTATFNGTVL